MISQADVPIVSFLNDTGYAQLLPVFEHVSNFAPAQFDNIKPSDDIQRSHVALDIAANDLAKAPDKLLDAKLVLTPVSRPVYDPNRSFDESSALLEAGDSSSLNLVGSANGLLVRRMEVNNKLLDTVEKCHQMTLVPVTRVPRPTSSGNIMPMENDRATIS